MGNKLIVDLIISLVERTGNVSALLAEIDCPPRCSFIALARIGGAGLSD
jgi:hypothetical protein